MKDAVMRTKPSQSGSWMIVWERQRMIDLTFYRDLWQLGNKSKNMKPKPNHAETSQNTYGACDNAQTSALTLGMWLSRDFRGRRRLSVPVFCVSPTSVCCRRLAMPMLVSLGLSGVRVHLWIHTQRRSSHVPQPE